jgi:hypothetical protein
LNLSHAERGGNSRRLHAGNLLTDQWPLHESCGSTGLSVWYKHQSVSYKRPFICSYLKKSVQSTNKVHFVESTIFVSIFFDSYYPEMVVNGVHDNYHLTSYLQTNQKVCILHSLIVRCSCEFFR